MQACVPLGHGNTCVVSKPIAMADLRIDFHCQEETEAGMGRNGMELLLQRDQPLRSKMNILQQDPTEGKK